MKTVELVMRITYKEEQFVNPPELWDWNSIIDAMPGENVEVIDSRVIS